LPVHLAGRVENDQIRKNLLKSHVVVLLSDWEGFGLALLEGMACGLVPIGLRRTHSGAMELIEDGVTGLLVDDRRDGFVAAVRRLREDPALWQRLARSARAQVEAEYGEERCAARWQELLRELVNDCTSRKPLRIPRRLDLPPVHPALAVVDERVIRPHQRLIGRARRFVNRVMTQSGRKVGS
jgi:colanic acid/amylovoran biosynthesis glycosyltransferase